MPTSITTSWKSPMPRVVPRQAIREHRDYQETFRIRDMEGNQIRVHLTARYTGEWDGGSQYLVVCEKILDT